jgi:hypothetical protein
MIVHNLATNEEHVYADSQTKENAVCYSYCCEHGLDIEFINADLRNKLAAFKEQLPIVRFTNSIACGDWATIINSTAN